MTILFFRSEEGVQVWCAQKRLPRGEILSLEQAWALAKAWYHNRMDPDYRGRTAAESQEIFHQVGLRSSFWYLESPEYGSRPVRGERPLP